MTCRARSTLQSSETVLPDSPFSAHYAGTVLNGLVYSAVRNMVVYDKLQSNYQLGTKYS